MRPERSHVIADGMAGVTRYTLYASRAGQAAETVVLIHGVGMNRSVWAPQVDALTAHFQVLAYDMPGHGESALPSAEPTLAEYAMRLAALLDALKIERAHVVGHSMGALVALEFALTFPDRTSSVAALNAVYDRTPGQRAAVMDRASTLDAGARDAGVDATIARWFGVPVPAHLEASARDLRALLLSVNPEGYARTYRLFASSDAAHVGRLGALAMPELYLTGEFDPNSSPAMSEAMAAASRDGRAEIIGGARHMMNVTDAARVNERLGAFLTQAMRALSTGGRHD
ncbi:Beta-ketoadipate enol-lactone hydrolase [Candidatus Burkholderia verschuerenii]|uniref:Beta-ketoadipate enol-lactone hydrolase n=1 Tax=Candidatus Burkholderia verschuerenii TaxID=242163 RepID=A0A0L0ME29_9BURK|nr:alpha/beta fold hydrolase [Candidatus Burkholderia verschuerenii]KND60568.1 Beta-ketoadipate enol-lactone hydrolase [Candidatus Burkholderia verschuerenii]